MKKSEISGRLIERGHEYGVVVTTLALRDDRGCKLEPVIYSAKTRRRALLAAARGLMNQADQQK